MTRAAAKTRTGPALTVAMEQHFPKTRRIIEDTLAGLILPPPMRIFL
jgi:hypothetical protein